MCVMYLSILRRCTVQFSSVQDGIYALGKAHNMCSTQFLRSFPNVAFEMVPVFIWLTMALSHPFKEDCLVFPLSMPLSSRWSMVLCHWLCACRKCLKLLNISDLVRSKPLVRVALPTSIFARLFSFTPAKVDVNHQHIPVWDSNSTFHFFVACSFDLQGWLQVWSDCYHLRQSSSRHWWQLALLEDVSLVESMYLVFTRMPGETYHGQLGSLLLYLCYICILSTN